MRLTVASECSEFVVLGLCQEYRGNPVGQPLLLLLLGSAKWVAKTRYTYESSKTLTNFDSLTIHDPLLPLRSAFETTAKMSANPTEQYNYAPGYNIDPRLAGWSHIQLAPIRVDHSQNNYQGPLPYISPYAADIYPKLASPLDSQKCGTTGYVS